MKKMIKQVPIFEEVQTGTRDLEVWVTSDGTEFDDDHLAEEYEFKLQIKERDVRLPFHASMFYFENEQQVKQWVDKWDTKYNEMLFEPSKFQYPSWFVIYVDDNENDDGYTSYYEMKTLDDYKKFLVDELDELTK